MMADRRAASAQIQLLSLVCFCCPGLFNALSSIASGLQDPTVAFRGNVLIYATFAVSSVVAAALLLSLGVRRSLALGSSGYAAYALSLWNLSSFHAPSLDAAVAIFYAASVVLGVSAGFLWTTQGQMIMSYSTSRNQGQFLSTFWVIFNLGAAGGGLLTSALNWRSHTGSEATAAGAVTFAAFSLVMAVGVGVAATCIVPLEEVVKENGQHVVQTTSRTRSWRHDAAALAKYAVSSRDLALLLPFFVYSNWFYTYHAFFNVATFNLRSSGLASACYWTAQMLAASWLGEWLDAASKRDRAATAASVLATLAVLWNGMWAAGLFVQLSLSLAYDHPLGLDVVVDASRAFAPLLLYIVYGAGDALGQVWIYWYLSSVCSSGRDLRTAGFNAGIYKGVQALSAAVSWYIGSCGTAPTAQLWTNWALSNAAIAGAALSLSSMGRQEATPFNGGDAEQAKQ